ncbi:4-hydroxy-tetrahydrodipicolinate reductase [Buchnera aphidicola]|uniref:4-hydroxy-tetrahydrodipicolinate reductase n=1 Tax=Buchnera aphidicola (Stegophylla sp.) TaxID=2315800 RepID=A0A4D6Y9C3_9GAMM|nr:4-hydroxy-tetrahydrodipicolinate reductase [Buchnera aphidicola (Stegophylla sp.)]QCI26287.1 4-hydroxy-tetrahydrodipicolinate reductase [Buchnera aphidicola (Stegophylla sp.)]
MNKKNILITITGAYGRMGTSLIQEIKKHKNILLNFVIVKKKKNNIQLNQKKQIEIIENIENLKNKIHQFDVLIDFSTPKSTLQYLEICKTYKKNIIIGTTGFNQKEINIIKNYSKYIGIVFSYNFSVGINLIFKLLKTTSQILDSSYDIEILESHHRNKIDSPSGTALKIGEIIAKNKKWNLEECSIYRKKEITQTRKNNKIGFSIIRGGDTIGEHTIIYAGIGEKIQISHIANNRDAFSKGAIKAAIWIQKQNPGLYNMMDVLNI